MRSVLGHLVGSIDALGLEAVFLIIMDSLVHLVIALFGLILFIPGFLFYTFMELVWSAAYPHEAAQKIKNAYERFVEIKVHGKKKVSVEAGDDEPRAFSFWETSEGIANEYIIVIWESITTIVVTLVASGMFAMLTIVRTIVLLSMGARWAAFTLYWHLAKIGDRKDKSSAACA